jgi:hypothetical protein
MRPTVRSKLVPLNRVETVVSQSEEPLFGDRGELLNVPPEVDEFPLRTASVAKRHQVVPLNINTLFHYTGWKGLDGILRSGGFWALHRGAMEDVGEFGYARNLVFGALLEIENDVDRAPAVREWALSAAKNLRQSLSTSIEECFSYCACLTMKGDDARLWREYGPGGEVYAIGVNVASLFESQLRRVRSGYHSCGPMLVIYDTNEQHRLVQELIDTAQDDVIRFIRECPGKKVAMNGVYQRLLLEVTSQLHVFVNVLKAPRYAFEAELRFFRSPIHQEGKPLNYRWMNRNGVQVPYLELGFGNLTTGRIPLDSITLGPGQGSREDIQKVERLLIDCGYSPGSSEWPSIRKSSAAK